MEKNINLPDLISSYRIEITAKDRRSCLFDLLDDVFYLCLPRAMVEIGTEMTVDKLIDLIRYATFPDQEAMSLSGIFIYSIEKHPLRERDLDGR